MTRPCSSTSDAALVVHRPTFDVGFSTPELTEVFSAHATVKAILEFEAALALALADAGIADADEVKRLAEACQIEVGQAEDVLASTWEAGTPINAMRELVTAELDAAPARWFHFGATTQDAVDTGLMLQARRGFEAIDDGLVGLARSVHDLTLAHRDQPHLGRTFLQNARPTTFGLRTAGWLEAVVDHIVGLRSKANGLTLQLGGSVGTLVDYGDSADAMVAALSDRLELEAPTAAWHGDRTRVLALAQALERTARTMAKIATDVALLASSEISEITVRSGGSSSMPEKQNPIDSVRAIAASSACIGAVAMLTGAPPQEMDRGVGGWHAEWMALPLAFHTTGAAVEAIAGSIASLEVDRQRMESAVDNSASITGAQTQIDRVLSRYHELIGSR